jgi:cytochrome c oxidase assembly protein subunit 15
MDQAAASPTGETQPLRTLSWGFVALTGATFALIVLGALVRAHGAGLACPDRPLCFGEWIPPFDLRVAFEWSHRALAGSLSFIFAGLTWGVLRDPVGRNRCGRLLIAAAALLVLQIVLGALTVWQLLASWTVTAHLLTGNAFAACLLCVALRLRGSLEGPPPPLAQRSRVWVGVFGVSLGLQLLLGGLVASRYAGLVCPEWPTCANGAWFPSWEGAMGLHLLHRSNGYLLGAVLLGAALATRRAGRVGRVMQLALVLGLAQVVVGVLNVRLALPVEVTGLHSALAAALVLCLAAAASEAFAPRRIPS